MMTELEDQPLIDRIKCEIFSTLNPSFFEAMGVKPRIVYRADHEEWVIAMIQANMGMSIMPEWERVEGITYVPIAKMQPIRTIGLQWNGKQNLKLVNLFHSFVIERQWFDEVFYHRATYSNPK